VSKFSGRAGGLAILHVDDDPMNLRVVEEILIAFGHIPFKASSGAEALEHLGRDVFDVVLMDIHMPQMSGIEVVQRLRASVGPERNTPVIALTSNTSCRTRADYVALGFVDLVPKPILVSRLHAAIVRAAASRNPRGRLRRVG
jgi:CheY-like chemotaxis protein